MKRLLLMNYYILCGLAGFVIEPLWLAVALIVSAPILARISNP